MIMLETTPKKEPFNISLLNTEEFIRKRFLLPVQSNMIKLPSTNEFHPEGLFSEEIFGNIGTEERFYKSGYIQLNTTILHPLIYKTLISISSLYSNIMSSKSFAKFDTVTNDFIEVPDVSDDDVDVDTGYAFFMQHLDKLKLKDTGSLKRKSDIKLFEKYKTERTLQQHVVLPAGIRDVSTDDNGVMIKDDINKAYSSLLSYSQALPANATSSLYDSARYQMQLKAYEIYEYINNILKGKRGFSQGHFAARNIALGTRNVISATDYSVSSPYDPRMLKSNETKVGLYQTMKGLQPLIVFGIRSYFMDAIFTQDHNNTTIALVNPKTLELEYKDITDQVRQRFTSESGIVKIIDNFLSLNRRDSPIIVHTADNKKYYMALVYDLGDKIYYFKSISDLRARLPNVDKSRIRPMTYSEMLYCVTDTVSKDKHTFITRYPVLGEGSVYVSKVHLVTTINSRTVNLFNLLAGDFSSRVFNEYPVFGSPYIDTVVLSAFKLKGLSADYDGDVVSCTFVLTEEANTECAYYLDSPKEIINTQKQFTNVFTDTMELTLRNLTMMPTI